MRAVVQRTGMAGVSVVDEAGGRKQIGRIERGLLVYAAASQDDADADLHYIADKIARLRIFPDELGKMNLDVVQAGGSVLLVSAFSVLADARHGRRPSFANSADGATAEPIIDRLAQAVRDRGLTVETGRFAAHMHVEAVNDGPICILLDSHRVI